MVNFFINRPIFATVIAVFITLVGAISITLLPKAQYPPITPPTVQVAATYTGASAEVLEKTVTTPIEEQINGVEGMIYMSSTSSSDGNMNIIVTFEVGYDQDIAAVDTQNRVQIAEAVLPEEVAREGITVRKESAELTLAVNLISPDERFDDLYLSNYATIHVMDVLRRVPGVGEVQQWGPRTYAMRIWLDPDKLASMGLTAMDIAKAVKDQNIQVASGAVGQPPAPPGQQFQFTTTALGRLSEVSEFEDIIVRANSDGSVVYIKDIGRVELGAKTYDSYTELDGKGSANIGIFQLPGANALDISRQVEVEMERLSKRFPEGLEYEIIYNTTTFVKESMKEVLVTLLEAFVLVFLVVYVFLQGWRPTLIPAITIPVSIVGTFAVLKAIGFSINILTLFGVVLAIGLVVDDAIVVVENVTRFINERGMRRKDATREAMKEVTGPIVATTLVLMAVFIPVAFLPGITGQLYKQFAITIASTVGISAINALTLSPALCVIFLRKETGKKTWIFEKFNNGFLRFRNSYERWLKVLINRWKIVLFVFLVLIVFTYFLFQKVPTAFVPNEDQGYFFISIVGPEGSSLERTKKTLDKATEIVSRIPGVDNVITFGGHNFVAGYRAPNFGTIFPVLAPWVKRKSKELHLDAIMNNTREELEKIPDAIFVAFNPPAIRGISATGGFEFELQDLNSLGIQTLSNLTQEMVKKGNERPELMSLFSSFRSDTPQLHLDLDRKKAKSLDIDVVSVFNTIQTYLGALYVNDFNKFGRVFRVFLQAEEDARSNEKDVSRLYVRSGSGEMVPLSALIKIRPQIGPQAIDHYNLYPAATINGEAAPGYSSGQAIDAMEQLAAEVLPQGMGYEWSGISYQQLKAGNLQPIVFALSLVCVFLFLAALYESWAMPFMVLLAVPLAIFGALGAQWLRGLNNDVYCQIGLVMLIGLASKNAILIVEFAKRRREEGLSIVDSVLEASRIRLRPILMTAFAFILGVVPLVIASGAGANSRHSLGTAVFGGMLFSTLLSLLLVPIFYVLIQRIRERKSGSNDKDDSIPAGPEEWEEPPFGR